MSVEEASNVFAGDQIMLEDCGYPMEVLATEKSPSEVRMRVTAGGDCPHQVLVFLPDDPVMVVEYSPA